MRKYRLFSSLATGNNKANSAHRRTPSTRAVALILVAGSLAWSLPSMAALCHVDLSATGANNGQTWGNAYTSLQSALGDTFCTEIWVAEGVYQPGTVRADSFHIRAGTKVYGGFAGYESNLGDRRPAAHRTILSGDIDNNDDSHNSDGNAIDETSADIFGANSYNVVIMDGTQTPITASTVLDGFTITGGKADENSFSNVRRRGGGLHCDGSGAGGQCSPTLKNLHFVGNLAMWGGAVFNNGVDGASSPTLENVTFSGNSAINNGGALFNDGDNGISSPQLTNVTFSQNHASVNGDGGAMYNYGRNNGTSSPILINVTFSGNSADRGGAIYNSASNGASYPELTNVILWGDAANSGPEIFSNGSESQALLTNCIVQGSGGSSNWDDSIGFDAGGNLDADPHLGALGNHRGSTPTRLPQRGGVAVDNGNDLFCPSTDQRGVARPQANGCDIGAVELLADLIFADGFGT